MLNQTILVGNLREVNRSDVEGQIKLAISRNFKDSSGEYGIDYVVISLADHLINPVEEYLKVGSTIAAKCRLESDGIAIKVIAEKLSFI